MDTIIETKNLTKAYKQNIALSDLNLQITSGSVVGFIGPNGAGKTTTMRILTTLLKPTSGSAYVAGYSVTKQPQEVRRVIGYMPDFFGVYDDMRVWEYLDFFGACYDIRASQRAGMIDDLLALVDLGHKKEAFVDSLSRGMKQRLGLARTLIHDPQLLILDEPASGLDPRARIEMRELLRELKNMGKSIFFSSHILSEVADICTSIAVLEAGRLVTYGNMDAITQKVHPHRLIEMRILGDLVDAQEKLLHIPLVQTVLSSKEAEMPANTLRFDFGGDDEQLSDLLSSLVRAGIHISHFSERSSNLEDLFLHVTKGIVQ